MSAEKLQKLANTKFDIKAAKLALLERVDSQLMFTYNGGLFKANPTLIAYVRGLQSSITESVCILDEYNNPIQIMTPQFINEAIVANQYALNAYKNEYEKLKKVRKGDKL